MPTQTEGSVLAYQGSDHPPFSSLQGRSLLLCHWEGGRGDRSPTPSPHQEARVEEVSGVPSFGLERPGDQGFPH